MTAGFRSKLIDFRNKKSDNDADAAATKNDEPNVQSVSTFGIFRFADGLDRILMGLGTIFGLSQAITQAFWLKQYKVCVDQFTYYVVNKTSSGNQSLDDLNSGFRTRILNEGVAVFFGLGLANILMIFLSTYAWSQAADRQVKRIRHFAFKSMMEQEIGWFDLVSPGDLVNRLTEDVQRIRDGIGDKIADFFLLMSRSFGGIVIALIEGWKMALVFICFMPLVAGTLGFLIISLKKFTEAEMNEYAKANSVAEEVLSSIRTVVAFGGQKRDVKRYTESLNSAKNSGIRKGLFLGVVQLFVNIFLYSSFAVLVWYGPLLVRTERDVYTPGTVMLVFFGVLISTFSFGAVAPNMQSFAEARGSAGKLFEIIDRKSLINVTSNDGLRPESTTGSICLENVEFSYPARMETKILDKLNISIPSGKTVALVGPSGCGKSTIIQLVQRFYDPDSGILKLDGNDLRQINLSWLRSKIGIVGQEPVLFYGTVAENIRLGKMDATTEEIEEAAKKANAHEFVKNLPNGYDTVVGERGSMLSGGQKQRIAIARAVIANPPILLLDEATSALDTESERIVQKALDLAGQNRTTLVVAHRLSTIRNADMIYVFEHGRIVDSGTHSELMAHRKLYYELVTAQSTAATEEAQPKRGPYKITHSARASLEKLTDSDDDELDDLDENPKLSQAGLFGSVQDIKRPSRNASVVVIETATRSKRAIRRYFSRLLRDLKIIIRIFGYNMPEINYIIASVVAVFVQAAILPVFAVLFTELFKVFTESDEVAAKITRGLSGIIFGIGVLGGVSTIISSYCLGKSGEELTCRMRSKAFKSMVYQDIGWFDEDENRVGGLLTRLSLDANQLRGLTGQRISILLQSFASVLIASVIALVLSWQLTLVMAILIPLVALAGVVQGKSMSKKTKSKSANKKKFTSYEEEGGKISSEALNNIRTVVSMRQETYFIKRYDECFSMVYATRLWSNFKNAIGNGIAQSAIFFIYGVAIGFGMNSSLVESTQSDLSAINPSFRTIALLNMVGMSLGRGSAFLVDFDEAREAGQSILSLLEQKANIDAENPSGLILERPVFEIEFNRVLFAYPTRLDVTSLDDMSFVAPAKSTTALVGPSGCGKSTTISLVLRFYDPTNGRITIDGYDVNALNVEWLRSNIGYVQQEPVLFDLTIKENILYGLPEDEKVEDEQVYEAAKMANIHTDIANLPMGYETQVGSKGTHLSGGQKQRIAIARALIRNPKILLLDEATSALDTASEQVVQAALDGVVKGRTTLSIAHRLSTIKNAERICVCDSGRVLEKGTHEELLESNGLYASLAKAQNIKS